MTSPTKRIVYTDADNTLWDTNSVFATAQLSLLSDVESAVGGVLARTDRLQFVRKIDQAIAVKHELGLRYPPRLLVKALSDKAPLSEPLIVEIEQSFIERVSNSVPSLRMGVQEGLQQLAEIGIPVEIITEGPESSCRTILCTHRLDHFIDIVISARKSAQLFSRLACPTQHQYFVGDQLDIDIALARQAGFKTIYFPSEFVPAWVVEIADVSDYQIESFDKVPDIVLGTRDQWAE